MKEEGSYREEGVAKEGSCRDKEEAVEWQTEL